MATKTLTSSGIVTEADFHNVTITGKTKGGNAVKITLENAINKGNIEWTFADKDEVVPAIELEACYDNTNKQADGTTIPPFKIEIDGELVTGAKEIFLGLCMFAIDGTDIALCRGGGSFKLERTFRDIVADGDKGTVKDRVVIDEERPKVSMNVLTMLTSLQSLYPAMKEVTAQG